MLHRPKQSTFIVLFIFALLGVPYRWAGAQQAETVPFIYSLEGLEGLAADARAVQLSMLGDDALRKLQMRSALRRVSITSSEAVTDDGLAAILANPDLESLTLSNLSKITDASVKALSQHANLSELEIISCPAISPKGLTRLKKLKTLRRLELSGFLISDNLLSALAKAHPKLEKFHVRGGKFGDRGAAALSRLTELKCVGLGASGVTKRSLKALAKLPNLESLDLQDCAELGKKDAKLLANLNALRYASLSGNLALGLASAGSLEQLESLELSMPDATPVFAALTRERTPKLRKLELFDCPRVTAASLEQLAQTTDLVELNLGWIESLDASAHRALSNFKTLERLVLCEDAAPSRAIIAELRQALPNCRISFE